MFPKQKTIKYTNHVLERMGQRQINKELVQRCVDLGVKTKKNNGYHYEFDELIVVLGNNDVTVMTSYWKGTKDEQ